MANFIGIKRIFYGDIITADPTPELTKTWLKTAKVITNSHDGTWQYTQDDPETTDYKNEMDGEIYERDVTSKGKKSVTWIMGHYTLEQKAELQGGEVITNSDGDVIGWKEAETTRLIYKTIMFESTDGSLGIFTYANIVGKVGNAEKILGLSVTATAMSHPVKGVRNEVWYKPEAGILTDAD